MAPDQKSKKKGSSQSSRAWDALAPPLDDFLLQAVSSFGYSSMTPVQAAVIPLFTGNSDVVVEATTGSGKTLAFLIPVISKLLRLGEPMKKHHVGAIIISPTRELATQIYNVLLSLLAFHQPSAELLPYLKGDEKRPASSVPVIVPQLLVGGTTKPAADLSSFLRHSPNVLVATPGRLAELLSSPHVNSQSSFEVLVLDEADRLLDMGFSQELQRILGYLPKQRRNGLFSASVSDALGELIRVNLRNPRRIVVTVKNLKDGGIIEEKRTPASLQLSYLTVPANQKFPALMQLLQSLDPTPMRSIVFLSTCFAVKYFASVLPSLLPDGFSVIPLHGKLEPQVRDRNFLKFTTSSSPTILLTTDVASRGIDIPQVDLVVQIDPPQDPKTFLHRCGRAGRAGRRGLAVVMLLPTEDGFIPFMDVRRTPIAELTHPAISIAPEEADRMTSGLRSQAVADREVFQLAQRAFVSWARFYLEHRATSIFRIKDLDWVNQAHAWGLVQLPKMPELRGLDIDRGLGLGIDANEIRFKDKTKEKKRQAEAEEWAAAAAASAASGESAAQQGKSSAKRKKNEAWSEKHEKEDVRVARREKRRKKREAERYAHMTDQEKEDQKKLDDLIGQIRRKNEQQQAKGSNAASAAAAATDEFEGFGD
ncbi:uncharacterized protein E0L32_009700 [Thyridium curvatum]|uniref:ATP-dependent RNA helicase n=1 Tax=Thyridium curvatum TaxID=1093900 RepID=A0A507AI78_9PEZI|nr:uncharacterized protein E0L32_009700 [Thyridium curvatum]TPX08882.1 hypothetical protein E0L32_009700 [Thyridium curvatum]